MSNIEEVPIVESEAIPEEVTEPVENIAEPEATEPTPKKKGRPKGSTKKKTVVREPTPEPQPDPKPKPKRAAPKPKPIVEEVSQSSGSSYEPVMDTRQIAAEVLHLLSNRHMERSEARRAKYRSWFENPQY